MTSLPAGAGPPYGAGGEHVIVTVDGTDLRFPVHTGEPVLAAARRAGVWLPFECGWGSCGTCKVTVVDGELVLLYPDAPAVDARDARRRRSIVCQATAGADVTIKALRVGATPERPTRDYVATLAGVRPLGPAIHAFRFTLDQPADYRPGQYALLHLGDGLHRCYSMAGLPGTLEVEFVAKDYARPGSAALFALDVGDSVPLELPYGDMWLRPDSDRIVLVAGGTGIAPILALLRQLVAERPSEDVTVVFGANTHPELVLWEELEDLVGALPAGRLLGVLAQPPPDWSGEAGLVPDVLPGQLSGGERVYLAGPPAMVDATLPVLRAAGVPLNRIHYDRFG